MNKKKNPKRRSSVFLDEVEVAKIREHSLAKELLPSAIRRLALLCCWWLDRKKERSSAEKIDHFSYEEYLIKKEGSHWVEQKKKEIQAELPLEFCLSEMNWNDIWYAHPGSTSQMFRNERWIVGTWTGPDNDLICIAPTSSAQKAEELLSRSGYSIEESIVQNLYLAKEKHPDERLRKRAEELLQYFLNKDEEQEKNG